MTWPLHAQPGARFRRQRPLHPNLALLEARVERPTSRLCGVAHRALNARQRASGAPATIAAHTPPAGRPLQTETKLCRDRKVFPGMHGVPNNRLQHLVPWALRPQRVHLVSTERMPAADAGRCGARAWASPRLRQACNGCGNSARARQAWEPRSPSRGRRPRMRATRCCGARNSSRMAPSIKPNMFPTRRNKAKSKRGGPAPATAPGDRTLLRWPEHRPMNHPPNQRATSHRKCEAGGAWCRCIAAKQCIDEARRASHTPQPQTTDTLSNRNLRLYK